jgi:uncharacterized protein
MERIGDWMQTYTGKQFFPVDPREEDVCIEDIAHALSMLCRYGGHCLRFYSVAEHCVHAASLAPKELKLVSLLHDASEAYLCDIIRPLKCFLSDYIKLEQKLEVIICRRFSIPYPFPKEVKRLDDAMLTAEKKQNMERPPEKWYLSEDAANVKLQYWLPEEAEHEFLKAFREYV